MKVLVIDTALNACTAAVFDGDRPLGVRIEPMAKGHQERIGGFVRDAVAEAASPARVEIPTTGTPSAAPSPWAKARPTRRPVKEPGPTVTPIRSR